MLKESDSILNIGDYNNHSPEQTVVAQKNWTKFQDVLDISPKRRRVKNDKKTPQPWGCF